MSNTTETQNQAPAQEQELNIWAAIDILCQAVEAAQNKGGVYNLKDAALLSKCVDVARTTLEQVAKAEQKPQTEQAEAAQ
jgi:hypothetical protein